MPDVATMRRELGAFARDEQGRAVLRRFAALCEMPAGRAWKDIADDDIKALHDYAFADVTKRERIEALERHCQELLL